MRLLGTSCRPEISRLDFLFVPRSTLVSALLGLGRRMNLFHVLRLPDCDTYPSTAWIKGSLMAELCAGLSKLESTRFFFINFEPLLVEADPNKGNLNNKKAMINNKNLIFKKALIMSHYKIPYLYYPIIYFTSH